MIVELYSWDRRRVTWTVEGVESEDAQLAVSVNRGQDWQELQRDSSGWWAWVAGPLAPPGDPERTVRLVQGRNEVLVRVTAAPEVITEGAGFIDVRGPEQL